MAVIGITGSIGSGKTTFRDLLASRLGADVFDADLAARDLLENDEGVRNSVCEQITPAAYGADGRCDRTAIRSVVFADPAAKRRLEQILHPPVRERWTAQAADPAYRIRHFLVDIPLLFETNAGEHFDWIVTVACSGDVQRQRLAARGLGSGLVEQIIASQLPPEEKIARSTHVVWNDGAPDVLVAQAEIFAAWLANAQNPAEH